MKKLKLTLILFFILSTATASPLSSAMLKMGDYSTRLYFLLLCLSFAVVLHILEDWTVNLF